MTEDTDFRVHGLMQYNTGDSLNLHISIWVKIPCITLIGGI